MPFAKYFNHVVPGGILPGDTVDEVLASNDERRVAIIGTPDDAIARLKELAEQSGGFGTFVLMGHEWADPEATQRSLRLFAAVRRARVHRAGRRTPAVLGVGRRSGGAFRRRKCVRHCQGHAVSVSVTAIELDVTAAVGEPAQLSGSFYATPQLPTSIQKPLLVCLPGGTYNRDYFDLQVSGYSFVEHMIEPRLRTGHSRSIGHREQHPSNREIALADQAAAMALAVRQLPEVMGHAGPYIGIGHSMGGYVGMLQQHHDRSYLSLLPFSGRPISGSSHSGSHRSWSRRQPLGTVVTRWWLRWSAAIPDLTSRLIALPCSRGFTLQTCRPK